MSKATCSVETCDRVTVAKGFCDRHYRKWRRNGDPLVDHTPVGHRKCAVDGCDLDGYTDGMCYKHDHRRRLGLDMDASAREVRGGPEQCKIDGCDEARVSRGMCENHYRADLHHGDPLVRLVGGNPRSGPCKIEDCPRRVVAWGYCDGHYRKLALYGDPLHEQQKHVTREFDDHPSGCRVMRITDTKDVVHEVLYDHDDEDVATGYPWYINAGGYAVTPYGPDGTSLFMSRMLVGLSPGDEELCDHINGRRNDNRRMNLRVATDQLNQQNRAIENHEGSSRFRNVYWDEGRRRWVAQAKIDRRPHHVGRFRTEEEAAAAVARFREQHGIWPGYGPTGPAEGEPA